MMNELALWTLVCGLLYLHLCWRPNAWIAPTNVSGIGVGVSNGEKLVQSSSRI